MTYEESPDSEDKILFPPIIDARIKYQLSSLSKTGQRQAKCDYLYDGKEYKGIIFSQDNEDWLKDVEPGVVIKAENITPCKYDRYKGEYMGRASPISLQPKGVIPDILKVDNNAPDILSLIQLLRSTADQLETMQPKAIKTNNLQEIPAKIKPPVKLPYKRSDLWETIIKKIVMEVNNFKTKPFSGISLNAYIDASFADWEEGDLEKLTSGPRWKIMVHGAVMNLLEDNFIEKVPGYKKHYRVTKRTLDDYSKEISLN